jgi:hypothetical protein
MEVIALTDIARSVICEGVFLGEEFYAEQRLLRRTYVYEDRIYHLWFDVFDYLVRSDVAESFETPNKIDHVSIKQEGILYAD